MFEQHAAAAFDEEGGGDRHIVVLVDVLFCFVLFVLSFLKDRCLTFCDHHLMASSEIPSRRKEFCGWRR
jgi:hypothetical protein